MCVEGQFCPAIYADGTKVVFRCFEYKGIQMVTQRLNSGLCDSRDQWKAGYSSAVGCFDRSACTECIHFTNVNDVSVRIENDSQISIHWSPNGDFLAVKAVRYPKKKSKTLTYQISIVRLCEKNAPVEVMEENQNELQTLPVADAINQFAWEPLNTRFAVLTTDKVQEAR